MEIRKSQSRKNCYELAQGVQGRIALNWLKVHALKYYEQNRKWMAGNRVTSHLDPLPSKGKRSGYDEPVFRSVSVVTKEMMLRISMSQGCNMIVTMC